MVTHGEGVRIAWNLGTRAGSVDGTPRTALSQVGLLLHPPSENISGGTVRELDCTNDGGSVGEGGCLQDEVGTRGVRSQGLRSTSTYIDVLLVNINYSTQSYCNKCNCSLPITQRLPT